jgi:hypothetical protein
MTNGFLYCPTTAPSTLPISGGTLGIDSPMSGSFRFLRTCSQKLACIPSRTVKVHATLFIERTPHPMTGRMRLGRCTARLPTDRDRGHA